VHPGPEIVDLEPARAGEAADVLARAFVLDPAWVWALPDERRRARVLPWFFRAATRYALRHGRVYATAGDIVGAAVVLPPERPRLDDRGLARAGLWQMPLRAGPRGFARFVIQGRALEARHDRDVPPRHGYVWLIGVDPARRGRGIGSAVLRAVTSRDEAAGVPTYLDTTNERNLAFYGRSGFEVAYAGIFPRGGCRFWTLVRGPFPRGNPQVIPGATPEEGLGSAQSRGVRETA
jgi:ribosomal protein S18 acetylase RimI-like enzyme